MVDTIDLFRKLGSGAKFDLKRFRDDADQFQMVHKKTTDCISKNDAIDFDALDFFGNSTAPLSSKENANCSKEKTRKRQRRKSKTEEDEDCVEKVKDVSEGENSTKKKKKKKKGSILDESNDQTNDDITIMKKKKKKKAMGTSDNDDDEGEKQEKTKSEKQTREKLIEQQKEKINIFRKQHRITVHGADIPDPIESFSDLKRFKVSQTLLKNLQGNSYEEPTPIQMQAIPILIQQRELLACAPTGSGKTLSFILPLLHHLKEPKKFGLRAVVVSPTRELAQQIHREFVRMNEGLGLKIHVLTKAKASTIANSKTNHFDILVATPNRLVHLLQQDPPALQLSSVEWLVLDEGDKLFEEGDAGFRDQVAAIFQACDNPQIRHTLFSATLANNVEEWSKLHLDNVIRINIGARNAATDTVEQELVFVGQESGKLLAMRQIILRGFQPPVLVFVQSKDRAKELFNELIYDGLNVDVIHADRTQLQRENVVKSFRAGKIWILIATELMGRGIDFKGVNMVVNYDFPPTAVSYIHRIGRTGRAGRKGRAVTFFTEDDKINLRSIANVMRSSGCEIPEWMLQIKNPNKRTKKKLSKNPIERDQIKTSSKYDIQKSKQRKQMIEHSKTKKKDNNEEASTKDTDGK
ncbi:probable ATP-dependent RNA helicase DDX52 [Clytia hemisphaerica]|uniref:Probable ATP-dependent RNA helicase DDX52 n=1 Tax=Clytia hemisphaerica TaxID=252671 RepID=A0A7M5WYP4_9CNID